jgi:hypothetical protein
MVCSYKFYQCFKLCSCPSTTGHHLPYYLWIIMVLTRRSIISQPNRVYTSSQSSLVPVLFSLSRNNTSSYYLIDCCTGFRRVFGLYNLFPVSYKFIYEQPILDYQQVWFSLIPPCRFLVKFLIPQRVTCEY